MPVYRKSDGVWRVRIWIEGNPRDWIVRGSKRDAETWEARQRLEIARGMRPAASRAVPKFGPASERYLEAVGPTLAPETLRVVTARLVPLVEAMGDVRLDALDVEVPRYQRMRLAEGRKPSTINDEVKRLRAVVNHYRSDGIPIPALKSRLLRVPKSKRVKAWSAEEIRRLLAAAETHAPRLLPLLVLQCYTGCRPGEAIRLRTSSADLDAGLLWIEPTGADAAGEAWSPKDREPRAVPIPAALRPWLERRQGETYYASKGRGLPWVEYPEHLWRTAITKAGLAGTPHQLRHTYASTWLARGGDLYTLSRVLGHSDPRLTISTYSHLVPGHLQGSAGLVDYGPTPGAAAAEARAKWGGSENRTPDRARPRSRTT